MPYFKSNEIWQEEFKRLKKTVRPSKERHISSRASTPKNVIGEYKGETQYDRYKQFINGVLHFIREGEIDYVYYIYQIEELLKYEQNLKTRYVRDKWGFSYFEVWL